MANPLERILVVDPDTAVQKALDHWLTRRGFMVTAAPDALRAQSLIEAREFALVLVEIDLPGDVDGFELLRRARAQRPGVAAAFMASEERFEWALESLRLGALDFVVKPRRADELGSAFANTLERRRTSADSLKTIAELQTVTDEFLRHMVRLERENMDLREKLENENAGLAIVDEFNVLVVTADSVLATELDALLRPRGMRLSYVTSGEEAIKTLDDLYYNLIIVDAVLPTLDGVDVIRRVHPKLPDAELVIVVGFTSADDAIRAMEHGATAFLVKPLEPSQAGERLDGIRRRHELASQSRKYISAFRTRYKDFLDRYQSVRQRLSTLKPEDLA